MPATETSRPSKRRRSSRPLGDAELRSRVASLRPGDVFSIDRPITVAEFCEYVSDEWAAELVNGVIQIMSPPSDAYEALAVWMLTLLRLYAETADLGEVRGRRSGVQIDGATLREPDLLFFRTDRLDRMTARGVHRAPDLAVEIIDSAASRREAVQKQIEYARIGVQEYWVIDLPGQEVRQCLLDGGSYRMLRFHFGDELRSRSVDNFRLRMEWLFQAPAFPKSLEVLEDLTSGD
jgi:Uma2 family endonuclease